MPVPRVGDEDLVAPAGRVKEVELGPVVGLFSSDDGPGADRPQRQIEVRQLGDLGPFADLTIRGDGLGPDPLRKGQHGQADGLSHLEAMENSMPRFDQSVDELVTGPGTVGADQHGDAVLGSRPNGATGSWARARLSTSMWSSALCGARLPEGPRN